HAAQRDVRTPSEDERQGSLPVVNPDVEKAHLTAQPTPAIAAATDEVVICITGRRGNCKEEERGREGNWQVSVQYGGAWIVERNLFPSVSRRRDLDNGHCPASLTYHLGARTSLCRLDRHKSYVWETPFLPPCLPHPPERKSSSLLQSR